MPSPCVAPCCTSRFPSLKEASFSATIVVLHEVGRGFPHAGSALGSKAEGLSLCALGPHCTGRSLQLFIHPLISNRPDTGLM